MSDIFISYKREEKEKAKILAEALEGMGFSVWWDPDINDGDVFDIVIHKELNASGCVIVLWSKKAVESDWVRGEATKGKNRLVPVMIEDVDIPVPFNLLQTANLIDWEGEQSNPEFKKLIDSVSKKLGRPIAEKPGDGGKSEYRARTKEKDESFGIYTNSLGMKFALIPAGEFEMGSPPDEEGRWNSEGPVHTVKISKPFYMGIHPVTQKEWKLVMGKDPSYFKGDVLPVEQISWNEVQEFIKKLNEIEGVNKYRLPSEAEWEYAVRAGTTTRYYFGDNDSELADHGWYNRNSWGKTHQGGDDKKPNSWGLSDMHGNIWEWVQDKWHNNYNGAPGDGNAWENGNSSNRAARGGSWLDNAADCRSASRHYHDADESHNDHGFRMLRIL